MGPKSIFENEKNNWIIWKIESSQAWLDVFDKQKMEKLTSEKLRPEKFRPENQKKIEKKSKKNRHKILNI